MGVIKFNEEGVKFSFRQKRMLKAFLNEIFLREGKILARLEYIFCNDEYLLAINKHFLQHDYYTDIITFDLSGTANRIVGEIYVSIDRVRDNSRLHHTTFEDEILRVVFHGALHLCGYGDKSNIEKQIMTDKENFYLQQFKLFHVETSKKVSTLSNNG